MLFRSRIGYSPNEPESKCLPVFPQPAFLNFMADSAAGGPLWPAANGVSNAAASVGNFAVGGAVLVLFGGQPSSLQCGRQKSIPAGAVFRPWRCGDGVDLVRLPAAGPKGVLPNVGTDAGLCAGMGISFIYQPVLRLYYTEPPLGGRS